MVRVFKGFVKLFISLCFNQRIFFPYHPKGDVTVEVTDELITDLSQFITGRKSLLFSGMEKYKFKNIIYLVC